MLRAAEESFLALVVLFGVTHLCDRPFLLKHVLLFFQVWAHCALRAFRLHELLLERISFQLFLTRNGLPCERKSALAHLRGVFLAIGCLVLRFLGERGRLLRSLPIEVGGSEHCRNS